jgi:hypothetical protein
LAKASRIKENDAETEGAREVGHDRSGETKIEEFAEDLGRLLGTARAKAEGWLGQRRDITKHLEDIRDTASHLLAELTGAGRTAGAGRGPGRPAGSRAVAHDGRGSAHPAGSGVKRPPLSAEARARIAAAQKARWAKIKAEKSQ